MPFGVPFPGEGITPQVTPTGPNDATEALITGFFNDARARLQAQDWTSVFSDLLTASNNAPPPPMVPVPSAIHPLGQMAAVFASTMAEQLGARGASTNVQRQIAQNQEERMAAEQENQRRTYTAEHEKVLREITIRMKINEARAEQAKQLNNLDEYEARLKTQAALRRELQKQREDARLKEIDASNKAILDRVLKVTAARGEQERKTVNYKMILKTAIAEDSKASDALKLWGKLQQERIFSRDGVTGEYIFSPEKQEQMAQEAYEEFLRRQAAEKHPDQQEPDFFDSFFSE